MGSLGRSRKVILFSQNGINAQLPNLIEDLISGGVVYIGVVGVDCAKIEDLIDEIVVGEGGAERPFVLTTSHPEETLEVALKFASSLSGEHEGETQILEI